MKIFYLGDPGNKQEDSIKNLNCHRRALTDDYQVEFNKIIQQGLSEGDKNANLNAAVALYLATYFDINNTSSQNYLQKFKGEEKLQKFFDAFSESPLNQHDNKFSRKIRQHFNLYHLICSDAELGDAKKTRKIL